MQMNTTTRKRVTVCPPAYSQCDERKRSHVAMASPQIISTASLTTRTNIFVGILWPPILSMVALSHGNQRLNVIAVFSFAFVCMADLWQRQHLHIPFPDRRGYTGR